MISISLYAYLQKEKNVNWTYKHNFAYVDPYDSVWGFMSHYIKAYCCVHTESCTIATTKQS